MGVSKIVITGGPCGGKTTGMSWIQNAFTKMGYTVIFVPETATEVLTSGVTPVTCSTIDVFQTSLFRLQMEKERIYDSAAQGLKSDKVLMVLDRGIIDNMAYTSGEAFATQLAEYGLTETQARNRYDAVFHLVTAAKGAEEYYSNATNAVRRETVEEAAQVDDLIIEAWTGHPHFRIIDNVAGFEYKMSQLIGEIAAYLGEQAPNQYKRKFLIKYPDVKMLESIPGCRKVRIVQTYLKTVGDDEVRVRSREADGEYIYCEIRKKANSGRNPIETERRLTEEEYMFRMDDRDPDKQPLVKDRYCLSQNNQYFEIDVYPFWNDRAIAGVEMASADEEIHIPEGLKVIREVTEDEEYRNSALAGRNISR